MESRNTVSLNGNWRMDWLSEAPYTLETEPRFEADSDSITPCPVPGYWEDMDERFRTTALYSKVCCNPLYTLQRYPMAGYCPSMALPNPVGCFLYQKTFTLTAVQSRTELYVGGAQNALSAWVNGRYLGRHEGYSTPFSFEIPDGVLRAGENTVTLAVSNIRLAGYMGRPVSGLTSRAANECTGGIYGDVELRAYPDGLKDAWVRTGMDCASFTVHTEGAADTAKQVTIRREGKVIHCLEIPAGETQVTVSAEGMLLWSPAEPNLYEVEIRTEHQTLVRRFGIRRLRAEGTKLLLNNEPYFFRGTCEHCYQPITVHPTREKKYYRAVIRKLKELGFNSIRFHTWIPPYEYMEAADEMGMLLEAETPNNTSFAEWQEIVKLCRRYTSVNMFSSGNEMCIDCDYEDHLRRCAELVHSETDALFSPMSAMRGVEYVLLEEDHPVSEPFEHNPARLKRLNEFCDVYNSYSLGLTSYNSTTGTQPVLDKRNAVYGKPLLSHEICIQGTYIDLTLEERYAGSRIGQTAFMSSVRTHLRDKGLLDRANLYCRNSAFWQMIQRKHCFETVRRCETFSGYDFLGDIDTHWHTFGYCVGMMNEFYELKSGETVANVLRYNGETVLLADLPGCVNLKAGAEVTVPVLVSHFGKRLENADFSIRLSSSGKVLQRQNLHTGTVEPGCVTALCDFAVRLPQCEKPMLLNLTAELHGGDTDCENTWELYVFPENCAPAEAENLVITGGCSFETLAAHLRDGKTVVIFGTDPFPTNEVTYQLSVAGRTHGHLATVIADTPLMADFPHNGYCARQFEHMLNGSRSAVLDLCVHPHRPIIDIASSYKNARREAMLFEYRVGSGRLLVCTLRLTEEDPGALWLKNRIVQYAVSEDFRPEQTLTVAQLAVLCSAETVAAEENENQAMNKNDITMKY